MVYVNVVDVITDVAVGALRLLPLCCPFHFGGGTSRAGLRSKKPSGRSAKPMEETGITGQSSGRGTCMWEKTYHRTTSVFSTLRLAAVHLGRPSPPEC